MREIIQNKLREALKLKNWDTYLKLVADAYKNAPDYDESALRHWKSLNASNYRLFKQLLSKIDIIFVTTDSSKVGKLNISGKEYPIVYEKDDPYETQSEMKKDVVENKRIKISIDYSEHPVFSVKDNVVFRTVHDYIVHILGNKPFGGKGEIASYNLHAKLVPNEAIPAIFTEVVGQASVKIVTGSFPSTQKIAVLKGFDFINVGVVNDYDIKDKELIKNA